MKVDLEPFFPNYISSTYDKTTFAMMCYTLSDDGWARHAKVESTPVQQGLDGVKTMLIEMKEQVDKIREVTKETGIDVAKLRMDMRAPRRQGIRAFNSMTENMNKITKEVETSYESFCTKVINTLKYFLGRN
ncbi:hypothetical protein A4A49_56571 [Nicotiana attenuata]|uniref:Uncharacterized protein n=1 Tax=Nicotiana attenuata TaxID=49451 RepID=A0A1J6IAX1_NICAT|nr:hypothetical protein A4A49_56571 [Nicotiana attenuata]